jgi:hypothetical protein
MAARCSATLLSAAILAATTLAGARPVLACASCGSGGDDPLILYPNERDKTFVSVGRTAGFRNISMNGSLATAGGPTERETLTVAYGHSFSTRSFATVTVPSFRNISADDSQSGLGDPSLATRFTLIMPDLTEPWMPQVQIMGAYKQSQARSVHDTQDARELLDVFGTGFSDVRAGVDLWFGQQDGKFGVAQTVTHPLAKSYDGALYQPGFAARSTVTLGYQWAANAKTLLGANREQVGLLAVDGAEVTNSDQLSHSVFVTQDYYPVAGQHLRLTISQQAAFGANKNTARSSTLTVAYQLTIRS